MGLYGSTEVREVANIDGERLVDLPGKVAAGAPSGQLQAPVMGKSLQAKVDGLRSRRNSADMSGREQPPIAARPVKVGGSGAPDS